MPEYVVIESVSPGDPGEPVVLLEADNPDAAPRHVEPFDPSNRHHLQMALFAQEGAEAGVSALAIASRFGYAGRLEEAE